MKALVLKTTGSNCQVKGEDGGIYLCKLKGVFRLKDIQSTSPVVVGDYVQISLSQDHITGSITEIHDRKNYMIRKSVKLSKQSHIIAANIDFAVVVATPASPRTSTGFIDRFLATSEAYSIPGGIIFNKSDLYNDRQKEHVLSLKTLYESIGYTCFIVSASGKNNLEELKAALDKKVNLFSGHSGAGKSTLINALIPGLSLKTGEISGQHLTGIHTTTFSEMHEIPGGGYIIDTPGIREFGILEFNPAEVSHYFPEIFNMSANCKFNSCLHINESDCAVLRGVQNGSISESRYSSYVSIFRNEDTFR